MNIDNLIDIFRVEVLKVRPELNDFYQGSILYTLARAVAMTANEVYTEVEKLKDSSLFIDSTVVNEELLVSINSSLARLNGSPAYGYVLVSNIDSNSVTLPPYTILTDPVSSLQFMTVESKDINSLAEVQVPILATINNTQSNLPAGRNLININYPRLIFTIGKYREVDNTFKGGLVGGVSAENNLEYYKRIKDRLLNLRLTQTQVLYDFVLSQTEISHVYIELLTGGLVIIWVKSSDLLTSSRLTELNNMVKEYLPIGTYSSTKQLFDKYLNLTIQVYDQTNLVLDQYIKSIVIDYVNNLKPSDTLSLTSLRNLIVSKTGLIVKIINPITDVSLANNETFSINNLEILNVS